MGKHFDWYKKEVASHAEQLSGLSGWQAKQSAWKQGVQTPALFVNLAGQGLTQEVPFLKNPLTQLMHSVAELQVAQVTSHAVQRPVVASPYVPSGQTDLHTFSLARRKEAELHLMQEVAGEQTSQLISEQAAQRLLLSKYPTPQSDTHPLFFNFIPSSHLVHPVDEQVLHESEHFLQMSTSK